MNNKLSYFLGFAFCFYVVSSPASPPALIDTPLNNCSIDYVLGYNSIATSKIAAEIAKNTIPVIDKYTAVVDEVKDKNKPVGEQFSKEQLVRFSELRQRLITLGLASLVESNRARDINVLNQMLDIAKKEYLTGKTPADKTEADTVYAAMTVLISQGKDFSYTEPKMAGCSYDYAITQLENPVVDKMNAQEAPLNAFVQFMKDMKVKYKIGSGQLDPATMSSADRTRLEAGQKNVLTPVLRGRDYVRELEVIKLMANTSDLMYAAAKNDLATGSDQIGATLNDDDKAGKYNAMTKSAIMIWNYVNEKIPSMKAKSMQESIKIQEQYKKP